MMTDDDKIEAVIQHTRHERYRDLLAADPETWRPELLRMHGEMFEGKPREEPALPSLWRQAASAGQAIVETAVAAVSGQPVLVSEEIRLARLAICEACVGPEGHFRPSDRRCSACGCFMDAKAQLAASRCPLEPPKWEAVENEASKPA